MLCLGEGFKCFYGRIHALKDVNIDISGGEIVIVGANGKIYTYVDTIWYTKI